MSLLDHYYQNEKNITKLLKNKEIKIHSQEFRSILNQLLIDYKIDNSGNLLRLIDFKKYFEEYDISYLEKKAKKLGIEFFFSKKEFTLTTLDACASDNMQPTVHLADYQIEARGQYARVWKSAYRQQIQTTIGPFSVKSNENSNMLMIKIAYHFMCILGNRCPNLNLQYKWPNDIYLNGNKVAGFLLTLKGDKYFISIGLNLTYQDPSCCIGSIFTKAEKKLREDLLLEYLIDYFENISIEKMTLFLNKNSFFSDGEEILYDDYNSKTACYYRGINNEFACCIQHHLTDQSLTKIYAGSLNKIKKNHN